MKVINLWGGPNTGKSTAAAGLFYVMKIQGHNVELVTEYAKDMVWEKRSNVLRDQLYILAKQNRRLERLRGEVDWVVTDSPIILGVNYAPDNYYDSFKAVAFDAWKTYENINFYLTSEAGLPYQNSGREQTPEQAKDIDNKVKLFLVQNNLSIETIQVVPHIVDPFHNHISKIMKILGI